MVAFLSMFVSRPWRTVKILYNIIVASLLETRLRKKKGAWDRRGKLKKVSCGLFFLCCGGRDDRVQGAGLKSVGTGPVVMFIHPPRPNGTGAWGGMLWKTLLVHFLNFDADVFLSWCGCRGCDGKSVDLYYINTFPCQEIILWN